MPVPRVGVLVGAHDVWSKPFLRAKLGIGDSLTNAQHYEKGGLYDKSVSDFPPYFDVGIFTFA